MQTSFMTNYIKAPLYSRKIEQVKYNACLVSTGPFKGTSRECLSRIGLELLKDRRWNWKMCFFYKIVKGLLPKYLT